MYVIKLVEVVGTVIQTIRSGNVGEYLVECDVDAEGGLGRVVSTDDITSARIFADQIEAVRYWKRESRVRPLRADLKPNRPCTVFTIEIVPAPAGSSPRSDTGGGESNDRHT